MKRLKRLRLVVRNLRANLMDMGMFQVDGEPLYVGLPAHAVGQLAAALAGGPLERLEIAGPAVDDRGRFELQKHLQTRAVFV